MTVFELRQALKDLPDDLEVIKSTSDGLFRAREAAAVVLEVSNDDADYIYEPWSLDYWEVDEDRTRKPFAVIR